MVLPNNRQGLCCGQILRRDILGVVKCKRHCCNNDFDPAPCIWAKKVYCSRLCRVKDGAKRWKEKNPERANALQRRFDKKRYERRKSYTLKFKYGITQRQKDDLLRDQGGVCANKGCDCVDPGQRAWQVDHDHATGVIRGILCWRCNAALGLVDDKQAKLLGLIEYLNRTPPNVDVQTEQRASHA